MAGREREREDEGGGEREGGGGERERGGGRERDLPLLGESLKCSNEAGHSLSGRRPQAAGLMVLTFSEAAYSQHCISPCRRTP